MVSEKIFSLLCFFIRYQKQLSSSLFIGEFIFSGEHFHVLPAGANGFALVSTKKLLSMTSYGHGHGNLI